MAKGVGDVSKLDQACKGPKVTLRALVASESTTVRKLLNASLEESGYRVTDVRNGIEALHIAQLTEPFDIILVDASDSILGSIDTVVQIRSLHGRKGNAPIVAIVEECAQKDVLRLLEAGFDEVFQAPIARGNLLSKCKQVIMHHVSTKIDGVTDYASDTIKQTLQTHRSALSGV